MQSAKINIKGQEWLLLDKGNEILVMGRLGNVNFYPHLKAIDVESALQYVWTQFNLPNMPKLSKDDLEWQPFASCTGDGCKMRDKCYRVKSPNDNFIKVLDCTRNEFGYLVQWKS